MLRINAGSGQRRFGTPEFPWVNCDINPRWEPDVVCDCARMSMFDDGSADIIVAHHTLEHYGCGDGDGMIRECHRILCHGGSLIICVPDMRALATAWLQGRISTQIYLTNVYGAFMNSDSDRHRWGFDTESLKAFIKTCGFDAVKSFDWRDIPGSDIARDWWVLSAEAIK